VDGCKGYRMHLPVNTASFISLCFVKMKLKKKSCAMELHYDRTRKKEKRRTDETYMNELRVGTISKVIQMQLSNQ
jgi:hypothetical protein